MNYSSLVPKSAQISQTTLKTLPRPVWADAWVFVWISHVCAWVSIYTKMTANSREPVSMKLLKNEHSEVVRAWRIIWRVRWQLLWSPKESGHSNVHDRVQNGDWSQGKQSGLTLQASPLYVLAFLFGGITNSMFWPLGKWTSDKVNDRCICGILLRKEAFEMVETSPLFSFFNAKTPFLKNVVID